MTLDVIIRIPHTPNREDGNTEFGCLLNIIYLVLHLLS